MTHSSLFVPVLGAQEMAMAEKKAIAQGANAEAFMEKAGEAMAQALLKHKKPQSVLLLVGPGNNGGDAYATGLFLMQAGITVSAHALKGKQSPLNRLFKDRFLQKGGKPFKSSSSFDLIIDGLFGTGFQGPLPEEAQEMIAFANQLSVPIAAIDIPSGIDATTGKVSSIAIQASLTFALGTYKSGLFFNEGKEHRGSLCKIDFGLDPSFLQEATPIAHTIEPESLHSLLPPIRASRHKYEAGYVVGMSGSSLFRGAPKLSGMAALRSGAGIVRVFYQGDIGETPFELIAEPWKAKRFAKESQRASSFFIGPGWGKNASSKAILKTVLQKNEGPWVIDADAIQPQISYPKRAVLTPHRGEAMRLLSLTHETLEEDLLSRCQMHANRHDLILLLKGAPTWIFAQGKVPVLIKQGDPGMATAGSGDVLTGIIAALLAQKMDPWLGAITGALIHGLAGESGAKEKSSYALIATDLIDQLPKIYRE